MPTKSGRIKPSDIRQGLRVWMVKQTVSGDGVYEYGEPTLAISAGKLITVDIFQVINKDGLHNYKDTDAYFWTEDSQAIFNVTGSEMGYPPPNSPPFWVDRTNLFSAKKHAERFIRDNRCLKPCNGQIQMARDEIDYYRAVNGRTEIKWTPLGSSPGRRIDHRRYLRIPGRGLHKVILLPDGKETYFFRKIKSKSSWHMGDIVLPSFANVKQVIPGLNQRVPARLPAPVVNNRKARKAKQRDIRQVISNYIKRVRALPALPEGLVDMLGGADPVTEYTDAQITHVTKSWVIVPSARKKDSANTISQWGPYTCMKGEFIMRPPGKASLPTPIQPVWEDRVIEGLKDNPQPVDEDPMPQRQPAFLALHNRPTTLKLNLQGSENRSDSDAVSEFITKGNEDVN